MKLEKKSTVPDIGKLYRVTIQGNVADDMIDWFGGMEMHVKDNATVLEGRMVDQSELQGLLRKIHDLHLTLISVETIFDENQNVKGM
jgi:hypothetical protein